MMIIGDIYVGLRPLVISRLALFSKGCRRTADNAVVIYDGSLSLLQ